MYGYESGNKHGRDNVDILIDGYIDILPTADRYIDRYILIHIDTLPTA